MTTLNPHQKKAVALALENAVGQFVYPTGTGKTLIESHIIIEHIRRGEKGVFVVLAPRIMLSQQLFTEIWQQIVGVNKIDCHFFSLHSGKAVTHKDVVTKKSVVVEDRNDEEELVQIRKAFAEAGVDLRNYEAGTSKAKLLHAVERAEADNVPLVICSTYDSSHRLREAGVAINILIADEAHNAVSNEFVHVHTLNAAKRFYFTATRKLTAGALGMNNPEFFGEILDFMSPREAVERKLILRPRLHIVKFNEMIEHGNEYIADSVAIEKAFEKHRMMTQGLAPKLLVACRGTKDIKQINQKTNYFERLRRIYPGMMVFSIVSGKDCALVNGVVHRREDFMRKLKNMSDTTPAIIMHYDILSEGIDVPGITGVMPLRVLSIGKFAQTLGRASRIHPMDRASDVNPLDADWNANFVKPYAWVIVPHYGNTGTEITESIAEITKHIREMGWLPEETVVISQANGEEEPVDVDTLFDPKKKLSLGMLEIKEVFQTIEEQIAADAFREEAKKMSVIDLLNIA